jgi:phage protein D
MAELSNGPLVPQIDVLINGSPVSAAVLRYVEDVVVDESVELPSMFAFAVTSSDAQEKESPWVDNEDLFSVGNVVEIKMGGDDDLASLIIGEITALEPEFVTSRLPLLYVRGYDRRHRLQRGRKTRSFLQKKDSDIADQVGREAGLSVSATDSGSSLDYVLQANQTDWEFLCERARLIRYEVVVNDKTLVFQPFVCGTSDRSQGAELERQGQEAPAGRFQGRRRSLENGRAIQRSGDCGEGVRRGHRGGHRPAGRGAG